jgi:LysM repeat protein
VAHANAQPYPAGLKLDSSYNYIQFYSKEVAQKLTSHFDNTSTEKLVFVHYGGSHIQAEIPTTIARNSFQEKYGNGGRGLIFNYGAANTYSSVNYESTFVGTWAYVKSFQGRKEIPLGVCGMSVDTKSPSAALNFKFKSKLETENSLLYLFYEKDTSVGEFSIWADSTNLLLDSSKIKQTDYGLVVSCPESLSTISIKVVCSPGKHFTFYGFNIEKKADQGVIYHSTGVGAAAIRSILVLDKLEQQLPIIEPDIVFLDFGTNDILYTNKIDPSLVGQVQKAITKIKSISPEALVVLTSTQDLFYKGKMITAGPVFRDLMDSIARVNNCLFWNWYDLAGGLGTIKTWNELGYAQSDGIHLNTKGYHLKGQKIFESFENTLLKIKSSPTISSLEIAGKIYLNIDTIKVVQVKERTPPKKKPVIKTYTVKSGNTLSQIAQKYHVSVSALKRKNNLKSDVIRPGQKLKIP